MFQFRLYIYRRALSLSSYTGLDAVETLPDVSIFSDISDVFLSAN